MRLATLRTAEGTCAARIDDGTAAELAAPDVGALLAETTPFGPYLVTPDELPGGVRPALRIACAVDGETVQDADTSDLVFDPVALVEYISRIVTLQPGDVIATGTPGGVGHARDPRRYLSDGSVLVTAIDGLGGQENRARALVEASA
jgi:acylpyruvate hydrolase